VSEEEKHESRTALSTFLESARSRSVVEDSKSMAMAESFHSPFSLFTNSRENVLAQVPTRQSSTEFYQQHL